MFCDLLSRFPETCSAAVAGSVGRELGRSCRDRSSRSGCGPGLRFIVLYKISLWGMIVVCHALWDSKGF